MGRWDGSAHRGNFGLQAETGAVGIFHAAFAAYRSIEEIATVELDRRLVGENFHDSSALGILQTGGKAHSISTLQHPAVVIARAEFECLEVCPHALADGCGFSGNPSVFLKQERSFLLE
jgi:hypothetical protein